MRGGKAAFGRAKTAFCLVGQALKKGLPGLPCLRLTLFLVGSVLVTSCSQDNDDLNRYIPQVKARQASPVEPIPILAEAEKFAYPEDIKRRSPFTPVAKLERRPDVLAPDHNRAKMPLERFPLDALTFVGTLDDGEIKWALIHDPEGRIMRVRPGDYMGQNFGKVIRASDDSLVLKETIKVGEHWEKKQTTFTLKGQD
ncbi:MAG: pilus assembly protein PilP [Legionellaceae bacterium]|nr:pilus assembly protein PilP [Legionellaceae bacterium]